MITQQEMRREANRILDLCRERRPEFKSQIDKIYWDFSRRLTSCAGRAFQNGRIQLSIPFFTDESNFRNEFFETVTHEIAHILAPPTRKPGRRNLDVHGLAWERMHKSLGGSGKRCHDMQLAAGFSKRRTQPEVEMPCYRCGKPMMLKPRRAKMYQTGIDAGTMGPGTGYGIRHARCPS